MVRRLSVLVSAALVLSACSAGGDSGQTASSASPSASSTQAAPAFPQVDAATIKGKVIFGYQGWFACPDGDTGDWQHWFTDGPSSSNLTVDFWPDTSEYPAGPLCTTDVANPSGGNLQAYDGSDPAVTDLHFKWMAQYGLDGVAAQRFVSRQIAGAPVSTHDDKVLASIRSAAEHNGRVFYVDYDLSSDNESATLVAAIIADWKRQVDAGLTSSPSYLHEKGLPIVQVYGIGMPVSKLTVQEAAALVDFFANAPDAKYHATLIGGLGAYWRTGTGDAAGGKKWARLYRSLPYIAVWAVGRYGSTHVNEAQTYDADVTAGDIAETRRLGIGYLPGVWPGSSWTNLMRNRGEKYDRNMFPRYCGSFFWQQAVNALRHKPDQVYVAMFDEVDEGTAMYKMVAKSGDLPAKSQLIALDVDGCSLDSDFYLRLGGALTTAVHDGAVPSRKLPIALNPGESLGKVRFTRGLK